MQMWGLPSVVAVLALGAAVHALAGIYTWTDETGHVYMTDDLSTVPPAQREGAYRRDLVDDPDHRSWNAVAPAPSPLPAARAPGDGRIGRRHVLSIGRGGQEMLLQARLDGIVTAPFVVDTGAAINAVPASVIREMGIEFDDDTLRTGVVGIGGQPMTVPIVTFARVEVGSASVENVEMAVLDTLSQGLLGMPFFNHFRVSTDPIQGTLTLEEIDLDSVEGIYGGLDEQAWRGRFNQIHHRIRGLEQSRDEIPDEFETASAPYREQIEEQLAYWRRQLDLLENRATRAAVPHAWRE